MFPVIPILMQLGVICRLTAAYCRTSPANAGQHGWSAMGHVVRGVHPVDPDTIINVYTVDRLILYLTSPYQLSRPMIVGAGRYHEDQPLKR